MLGIDRRKAWRRLRRLYDPRRGLPPWLEKGNGLRGNQHYRVNLSMLRASHPAFFDAPSVEDVEESLDAVREENAELRASLRALGAKVRDLSRRVAILEGSTKPSKEKEADEDYVAPFAIGAEEKTNHGLPPDWTKSR